MTDSEIRAFLSIALMAVLVDGTSDDRERAALKGLVERLGEGRIDLADVYRRRAGAQDPDRGCGAAADHAGHPSSGL